MISFPSLSKPPSGSSRPEFGARYALGDCLTIAASVCLNYYSNAIGPHDGDWAVRSVNSARTAQAEESPHLPAALCEDLMRIYIIAHI